MERKMPDRIKRDFSNINTVIRQFRELGRTDTDIIETIIATANMFESIDEDEKKWDEEIRKRQR